MYTMRLLRYNYFIQNTKNFILIIDCFIALCLNIDFASISIKLTYINVVNHNSIRKYSPVMTKS
jgi:hypothetical protein